MFPTIKHQRLVTCRNCNLPVGYVGIDQPHIQDKNEMSDIDQKKLNSLIIKSPVNVSLSEYNTEGLENHDNGNIGKREKVVCDGCGEILGCRITEFEEYPKRETDTLCQIPDKLEEKSKFFSFDLDRIEVEPLLKEIGREDLFTSLHESGGYFDEIEPIENSEIYSNDSKTWMRPFDRMKRACGSKTEPINWDWLLFLKSLVRDNEINFEPKFDFETIE